MDDPAAEFRRFIQQWLETTGWSQFTFAKSADIGQSLVSRWLSPDPDRRTNPSPAVLRKVAPVVGRSYDELMAMCGYSETPSELSNTSGLPAELAALIHDLESGWKAADTTTRRVGEQVVRAAFHVPRSRRSRNESANDSSSDAGLDNSKKDYRMHSVHA